MNKRNIAIAGLIVLAGLTSTACSEFNDERGLGDAPASQVDDATVPVWPGPNGMMNVGAYCIGENGVYIHTRVAPPVVIANDVNCDRGGILAGVRPADVSDVEDAPVVDNGEGSE